jgi:hypothetical protein
MEKGVELFVGIYFTVVGLSHLLQPLAWVEFFTRLRSWGRSGVFVEAFLALGFGAFVVCFHNVWSGLPAVVSAIGALQALKGALRFCAPGLGLRIYERVSPSNLWQFQVGGIVSIVLGLLCVTIWWVA